MEIRGGCGRVPPRDRDRSVGRRSGIFTPTMRAALLLSASVLTTADSHHRFAHRERLASQLLGWASPGLGSAELGWAYLPAPCGTVTRDPPRT